MPSVTMFARNDLRNDSRVWKEARALADTGWKVRLVGVKSDATAAAETSNGIDVVRVKPLATGVIAKLRLKSRQSRVPVFAVSSAQSAARMAPRPSLKRLALGQWQYLRDELAEWVFTRRAFEAVSASPSDVYHAHDLNAVGPAERARAKFGGRMVLDHHEFFTERNFFRKPGPAELSRLRAQEKRASRSADLNITVSESIADALQQRYGLPQRPLVVMNCPEASTVPDSVEPLRKRLQADGPVIIYIGAITFNRGLEQVIQALALVPGLHLALLGPEQAGFRAVLEAVAAQGGVSDRVHYLGPVTPSQVVATAAGADAAVLLIQNACLSYYYCSPNKLFESLAAGLPVVASDFPDLRKIIEGRNVGILCAPDDIQAIAAALREVLTWPREELRRKARLVAAEHTWDNEVKKLLSGYEQLYPGRKRI